MSALFLGLIPFGALAAAAPVPLAPAQTVVLVVAGWCAPCRAELAKRAEIVAAAAPWTLRVVALDDARSTRELVAALPPALLWRPAGAERARLAEAVYARSAGLPYAFATDRRGAICADTAGGLDGERTRALVARCAP